MSNVLKRHRNLSDYAFYNNAIKIRSEIIFMTNNEKYIPKRRRITIGNKTLNHALDLVEYIAKANAIFPSTTEMLFSRKWYQQKAIGECEALIECLRVIIEINNSDSNKKPLSVVYMLNSEVELLKRWKKATKLTKNNRKYAAEGELNTDDDNNKIVTIEDINELANKNPNSKQADNLMLQLMMLLEETVKPGSSL